MKFYYLIMLFFIFSINFSLAQDPQNDLSHVASFEKRISEEKEAAYQLPSKAINQGILKPGEFEPIIQIYQTLNLVDQLNTKKIKGKNFYSSDGLVASRCVIKYRFFQGISNSISGYF